MARCIPCDPENLKELQLLKNAFFVGVCVCMFVFERRCLRSRACVWRPEATSGIVPWGCRLF